MRNNFADSSLGLMRREKPTMIIKWSVCVAMMLTTSHMTAQDEGGTAFGMHSNGVMVSNGRRWTHLDKQSKIMLLVGVADGGALLARETAGDCGAEAERVVDRLSISGFHFSEIAKQIDAFYADTANLRIPVVEAYRFALRKLKGATPAELDAFVAQLRKTYNAE
jgi:hypothetical protein